MWHYRLITPDGMEIYPMPVAVTPADYDRQARIIAELNARHQVPDDWMESGQGWDVAMLEGDLHPSLLAVATLHDIDDTPTGDEEAA